MQHKALAHIADTMHSYLAALEIFDTPTYYIRKIIYASLSSMA